jgi:hypothetical protein
MRSSAPRAGRKGLRGGHATCLRVRGVFPPVMGGLVLSSKPCTATCILDGTAVTFSFYPDTQDLRISDAHGVCIHKTKWPAPWTMLHDTIRDFSRPCPPGLHDASALTFRPPHIVHERADYAAADVVVAAP